MAQESHLIQEHYTHGGLSERIIEFLRAANIDHKHPSYEDLFICDQLHARGLVATREHVEYAGIKPRMHVLDMGCAIGGSSRYIATACDCQVTGIDLTQEYIDVARELTARCGLDDRIKFLQGNALDMPFENATFDHVWSHNVIMNIQDKTGLVEEIARVLKRGGRYSGSEFFLGPTGQPIYPLPWATGASASFLVTIGEMISALESAGLRLLEQVDLKEANIAFQRQAMERVKRGEKPASINPQSFKLEKDFPERLRNARKSAEEGRLGEVIIVAEKM